MVEVLGTRIALPAVRDGEQSMSAAAPAQRREDSVLLGIRPEHIGATTWPQADSIAGQVLVVEPLGAQTLLTVVSGHHQVKVAVPGEFHATAGVKVWLRLDPARIRLLDPESGEALRH
jgi:multiple sugar transport system ATP-binding protein